MGVFFGVRPPLSPGPVGGDDFSGGIGEWTTAVSDADAVVDWYQSNSLRVSVNTGSTALEDDWGRATWNYTISGEAWDVEVGYQLLSGSGDPYHFELRMLVHGSDNQVVIMWPSNNANMRSYWYNGTVQEDGYYTAKPNAYNANLRFRITKAGSIFTTWHDLGTGIWTLVKQFTIPAFASSIFDSRLQTQRSGFTNVSSKFTNFVVNTGVIS